jgi:hypothetical protein
MQEGEFTMDTYRCGQDCDWRGFLQQMARGAARAVAGAGDAPDAGHRSRCTRGEFTELKKHQGCIQSHAAVPLSLNA